MEGSVSHWPGTLVPGRLGIMLSIKLSCSTFGSIRLFLSSFERVGGLYAHSIALVFWERSVYRLKH